MGFPISLGWCFASFCAGYVHAVLMHQKMGWPISPPSVLQQHWSLDQTQKMGCPISFRWCFSCFALALSTLCTKNGLSHFTTVVFCRTISVFDSRSELLPATISTRKAELSAFYGGSSPHRSDSLAFAILAVFDGGSTLNPFAHE